MSGFDVNTMSPVQRLDLIRQGETALKKRGDDPQIHYQLALLHRANGSMDNAIKHLQKVIKTRKADKDALAQLADIYAKAQDFAGDYALESCGASVDGAIRVTAGTAGAPVVAYQIWRSSIALNTSVSGPQALQVSA